MAVRGDHHLVRNGFPDGSDQFAELSGERVADRVGDVDGGGAGLHGCPHHVQQEPQLGPRRVLGGELHILGVCAGPANAGHGGGQDVGLRHPEHGVHVDVAGGDEHVQPRRRGRADRLPRRIDVAVVRAAERRDDGALRDLCDATDCVELSGGGGGKPGLDDVHAQACELFGDLELLAGTQRDAGSLLAVAEGGVEEPYVVRHRNHLRCRRRRSGRRT